MIHEILRCHECGKLFTDEKQTHSMYCTECDKLGLFEKDPLTIEFREALKRFKAKEGKSV